MPPASKRWAQAAFLRAYQVGYERLARPVIFCSSAQRAHDGVVRLAGWLDRWPTPLGWMRRLALEPVEITIGGAVLDHPLILAAGFVKGRGFESEAEALAAVERGENIIPGWRSMPRWTGLVEFGSFTRWPRLGNPGTVVWRDAKTRSTQNWVGLKNPGAAAAAQFLARRTLPPLFGINMAPSPGVSDPEQERQEVLEAFDFFLSKGIRPTWFTLNLSCPNTQDDPRVVQTEENTRRLCSAVIEQLQAQPGSPIPLWVKVGPSLADEQYRVLMRVCQDVGVRAMIATNTLPEPAPGQPEITAGVGGGRLHQRAVEVAALLVQEKADRGYTVDVIGGGGVLDGATYHDFSRLGIPVVQYWSAMIYRGPLAAALIEREVR